MQKNYSLYFNWQLLMDISIVGMMSLKFLYNHDVHCNPNYTPRLKTNYAVNLIAKGLSKILCEDFVINFI